MICFFIAQMLQFTVWTVHIPLKGSLCLYPFLSIFIRKSRISSISVVTLTRKYKLFISLLEDNSVHDNDREVIFPFHIKSFHCKAGKHLGARC